MKNKFFILLLFVFFYAFTPRCATEEENIVSLDTEKLKKIVTISTTEVSGQNAESVIRNFILKIKETQDPSEQKSIVTDLYDNCLNYGLNPAPDIADIFLAMALQAKDKGDMDSFERYLNFALTFDQKNPAIHQALATITLENKGILSLEYYYRALAGWLYSFGNFESRFISIANLSIWFRTFAYLFLLLIALILFVRYNALVRHDIEEKLNINDEKLKKSLSVLILFLPSIILLSGYWFIVYWACLFLIYANWKERTITIFALLSFLISGYLSIYSQQELFLSMYPPHFSNVRCYSNRISVGPDSILTSHLDPSDPLSDTYAFVLANRYLLHRSYLKAEKLYHQLLQRKPSDPYIMNNLGCLYYYQNRISEAIAEWSKAIEINPKLAVAYLNRSLGKNKQFDFEGAKEDQEKARNIDPILYQKFMEMQPDELIPFPFYPSLDTTKTIAIEQFKRFNKSLFGPLKPSHSNLALFLRADFAIGTTLMFIVSLYILLTKKRNLFARACYKCGRPFCNLCKTSLEFESFCGQCVHLFIKQDGVSPQARIQKNYEVEQFNKKGKIIRAIFSLLVPGGGHLWEGHYATGFFISFIYLFFLAGFISRIFEYPYPFNLSGGTSQSAYNFLASLLLISFWLIFGLPKALSRQTANIMWLRR